MARLNDTHRAFIVERLACFATHKDLRAEVLERFGVEVPYPQISALDPDCAAGQRDLAEKWKRLHAATRKRFQSEVAPIPIASKAWRLWKLYDLAKKAEASGNIVLAMQLLEQAAKEMGDAYTNKRVVIPADPADEVAKLLGLSADEVRAIAADHATQGPGVMGLAGVCPYCGHASRCVIQMVNSWMYCVETGDPHSCRSDHLGSRSPRYFLGEWAPPC
jgi:hypothetical protein